MDSIIRKHSTGKQKRNYFTLDTENAIIQYNNTKDPKVRSRIYGESIHYGFFKLTQNIIHTFKFYHTDVDNLEHLQHEIIIFLLSKIHLYNHRQSVQDRLKKIIIKDFREKYDGNFTEYVGDVDRVTQVQINEFIKDLDVSDKCFEKLKKLTPPKAYSYFGTIVKRWLILYNSKNYSKKIQTTNISELNIYSELSSNSISFGNSSNKMDGYIDSITKNNNDCEDELGFEGYKESDKLFIFIDKYIEYCTKNIYEFFPKKYDARIADSILELFRKRDNIDVFNKKALYIYIREMVEVKTPKITKIAKKLQKIYNEKYLEYLETGIFPS
tara:strand:+ start:245 stop:1225 length:981 start_codon:yes stop_codon:yes gene_type:complete